MGLWSGHLLHMELPETFIEVKECFSLNIHEIRELIKLIDQSSIQEFKLELEGTKVKLTKSSGTETVVIAQPAAPAPVVQAAPAPVAAPAAASVAAPVVAESPKAVPAAPVADDANLHKIISPMVGTFYSSPEPGKPAYVKAGDKVSNNKVVCIVEAMKLFNEIEAEVNGEIVKVLVEDGQLVEYGQPLFLVKPE